MAYRIKAVLILVALGAALVPIPAEWVERVYTRRIYASLQPTVTWVANQVPIALLDIAAAVFLGLFGVGAFRAWRSHGVRAALGRSLMRLATGAAIVYVLFLCTWGLNYRRVPLEAKLDFDRGRITHDGARRLAALAIEQLNAGYRAAHAQPFQREALEASFADVQMALGATSTATTGRPKRSLAGLYFRYAAIDGMTVPVFLEIIVNPDILPMETPSVLAHEWAHLAGYADESEANFVAWITGVRSNDPVAQYSAWLDAYRLSASALPRHLRGSLPSLESGPRQDLRDIAARYARSSPVVREAARDVYDSYLKANRVEEGIASYEVALQLILGTAFRDGWTPRRK